MTKIATVTLNPAIDLTVQTAQVKAVESQAASTEMVQAA
jgi:fructose-1-phosphate kinase PfkB-like protein